MRQMVTYSLLFQFLWVLCDYILADCCVHLQRLISGYYAVIIASVGQIY